MNLGVEVAPLTKCLPMQTSFYRRCLIFFHIYNDIVFIWRSDRLKAVTLYLGTVDPFKRCSFCYKWMKAHWKSDPCYKEYGVDGSDCSFRMYLSEVKMAFRNHPYYMINILKLFEKIKKIKDNFILFF